MPKTSDGEFDVIPPSGGAATAEASNEFEVIPPDDSEFEVIKPLVGDPTAPIKAALQSSLPGLIQKQIENMKQEAERKRVENLSSTQFKEEVPKPETIEEKAVQDAIIKKKQAQEKQLAESMLPEEVKKPSAEIKGPESLKDKFYAFIERAKGSPLAEAVKTIPWAGPVSPGAVEAQIAPGRAILAPAAELAKTQEFKIGGVAAIPFVQKQIFDDLDKKIGDAFLGYTSPGQEIAREAVGPIKELKAFAATQAGPIGSFSSILEALGLTKVETVGESTILSLVGTQLEFMASPNINAIVTAPFKIRYKIANDIFDELRKFFKENGKHLVVDEVQFFKWAESNTPSELRAKLGKLKRRILELKQRIAQEKRPKVEGQDIQFYGMKPGEMPEAPKGFTIALVPPKGFDVIPPVDYKGVVEKAGGRFIGHTPGFTSKKTGKVTPGLVQFEGKEKTTLALKDTEFSPEAVQKKLAESEKKFAPKPKFDAEIEKKGTMGGYESVKAEELQKIQEEEAPEIKESRKLKLSDEGIKIVNKYADRIGEQYVENYPEWAYAFPPETKNIRVASLNDLSVLSHKVAHAIDYKLGDPYTGNFMKKTGISKSGNPIYDSATSELRKEMTKLYVEYYPGGRKDHALKKRMQEGFATLLQYYAKSPSAIKEKFPLLVSEILTAGGRFHNPLFTEFQRDLRKIVAKYQKLDPLEKIGTRVVTNPKGIVRSSYLNFKDRMVQEFVDNLYPIEKLAKEAGVGGTAKDPSLWARQYNNSSYIIVNNIRGNRGYWTFTKGEFKKIYDFNWKNLVEKVQKRGLSDEFGWWLVTRDQKFNFERLDELEESAKSAVQDLKQYRQMAEEGANMVGGESIEDAIAGAKKAINEYRRFKSVMDKNNFDREVVESAYKEHLETFKEETDMHDKLVRADLDLLANPDVGLLTPKKHAKYTSKKGYASFKRDVYDEILGREERPALPVRVGKTKVSSMLARTGSELDIINPLYSGMVNHAEIMRKALRQIVRNKVAGIADKHPGLFQSLKLQRSYDPKTGKIEYPQEKDPNVLMARSPEGKRKPYLVSKEIKKVLDEVLTPQSASFLERIFSTASRIFTKGTTGLYSPFAMTNFVIDQITAAAQTRNKLVPVYDAIADLSKALFDSGSKEAEFFMEYLVMGGEKQTFVGWQDMQPTELFKALSHERQGLLWVMDALEAGENILAKPAQISEIMTRAAEYIKARQSGKSQVVALEDAGRVTAPFHHIGRFGGGTVGKSFVRSIPFFNPAIEVLAQFSRILGGKESRKRALFVVAAVTASMVGSALYLLKNGSQDQKDQFTSLEPEELAKYLWFPNPTGKNLIRVRIPDQMGAVATVINMAMFEMAGQADYKAGDYLDGALAWLPNQFDITDPARQFFSLIPQLLKPAISTVTNTKDFPKTRPLVSQGLKYKEERFQFNQSTSGFAKWLGNKLNLPPIKIDYLIEGYLGRATRFFTGKPDALKNPFVRDYYFTAGRNIQDFYELREKTQGQAYSLKHNLRNFSKEEVAKISENGSRIKAISKLLDDYRDIEQIKEGEPRLEKLRRNILDLIGELRD